MKLIYLSQVQKLLEDYDFQDKYKVMLELEEKLSELEVDGKIEQDLLIEQLGTPAQFASGIIDQYDLSVASTVADLEQPTIEPTPVVEQQDNNQQQQQNNNYQQQQQDNNQQQQQQNNNYQQQQQDNNQQQQNNNYQQQQSNSYNNNNYASNEQNSNSKNNKDSKSRKAAKAPVKIIFTIITIIFFLLAVVVLIGALIGSAVLLLYIDFQTAISFFLEVIFILLTIILSINFIKNIIYSIIDRKMKTVKLINMFIFIIVFAFLSKIMISSTLETVEMHISNNLYAIQNMFYYRNIDVSNIDWLNMDMGEYAKLFGDAIRSVL